MTIFHCDALAAPSWLGLATAGGVLCLVPTADHESDTVLNLFADWSAGPWFSGKYPFDVDATTIYTGCTHAEQRKCKADKKRCNLKKCTAVQQDAVQMAVLSQWSGAPPPTVYFLDGPETGPTAAASAPFNLLYRGHIARPITFTCTADSTDGKMPVLTHTCPIGWNNCMATFTVNSKNNGAFTVQCSNDAGLQDAPALPYSSSNDLFAGAAAPAANIFSLRKIFASYAGPALMLRRSTDNAMMNATYGSDGELNAAPIAAWCKAPACETFVDTWFDQGPNSHNAGKVVSDFHGGCCTAPNVCTPCPCHGCSNPNVSIADQPQLVLGTGKARAHIHFNGKRRMDATSPIDGNTGQTLLAVMQTDNSTAAGPDGNMGDSSDRLLSWAFVQNLVFPSGERSANHVTKHVPLSQGEKGVNGSLAQM